MSTVALHTHIHTQNSCFVTVIFKIANNQFDNRLTELRQRRLNNAGYNRDELERAGLMGEQGTDPDFVMAMKMQEEERRRAAQGR